MEDPVKKLEEKVEALAAKVQTYEIYSKIIGVVAIIFGLSGAWGYKVLDTTKKELERAEKDLGVVISQTNILKKTVENAGAAFDEALIAAKASVRNEVALAVENVSTDFVTTVVKSTIGNGVEIVRTSALEIVDSNNESVGGFAAGKDPALSTIWLGPSSGEFGTWIYANRDGTSSIQAISDKIPFYRIGSDINGNGFALFSGKRGASSLFVGHNIAENVEVSAKVNDVFQFSLTSDRFNGGKFHLRSQDNDVIVEAGRFTDTKNGFVSVYGPPELRGLLVPNR
ncbi:hypothetical protein [Ruegeria arenilitoris]|uniref:hypothetical protein n=1 Tax=Ruegeria arenilitoris TaxID=1173585 RepID=UPI00147F4497|nr:hypothetical protein [Ruegeria arenilitoris]